MFKGLPAVFLTTAAAVATVVVGCAGPRASSATLSYGLAGPHLPRLLGFAHARLVRFDPGSLRPLGGRGIRVGSGGCASRQGGTACWATPPWTVAPSGEQLVLARNDASAVRVVDAKRMRVTADIRVGGGEIGALAWLGPRGGACRPRDFS
jgi:hypothetical protein